MSSTRAVATAVVLGLVLASCAPDPSPIESAASDGAVAEDASDADAAAGAAGTGTPDGSADAADPEAEPGSDAEGAPSAPSAPSAPPAASTGRTVTWLDAEFLLPDPWRVLGNDGVAILLEHPTAAGPGGGVYVSMVARDGQPSAAQRAELPFVTAAGGTVPTVQLDAVFATGGPGLQVGAPTSQVVTLYSDTGIQVDISRDEGALTEAAVATVLALLATIEPPAVTPASEPAGVAAAPSPPPPPSPAAGGSTVSYGRDGRLTPRIETGRSGWDSSAYPDLPPFPVPDGFVLSLVLDGAPLAYNARSWQYVGPPGVDLRGLCLRAGDQIVAAGGRVFDGDCSNRAGRLEGVSEEYAILGFRPDGASVLVFVRDGSGICPTRPLGRNCAVWDFGMNLTPPG